MRLLLDTHVLLWWRHADPRLDPRIVEALRLRSNEVAVSVVSGWEVEIKRSLGKLEWASSVRAVLQEEDFALLSIELRHAEAVAGLPHLHRDPFDRLLIAQARSESLTLVTQDERIRQYPGVGLFP